MNALIILAETALIAGGMWVIIRHVQFVWNSGVLIGELKVTKEGRRSLLFRNSSGTLYEVFANGKRSGGSVYEGTLRIIVTDSEVILENEWVQNASTALQFPLNKVRLFRGTVEPYHSAIICIEAHGVQPGIELLVTDLIVAEFGEFLAGKWG